jgi:hypothetical protein
MRIPPANDLYRYRFTAKLQNNWPLNYLNLHEESRDSSQPMIIHAMLSRGCHYDANLE